MSSSEQTSRLQLSIVQNKTLIYMKALGLSFHIPGWENICWRNGGGCETFEAHGGRTFDFWRAEKDDQGWKRKEEEQQLCLTAKLESGLEFWSGTVQTDKEWVLVPKWFQSSSTRENRLTQRLQVD